MTRLRRRAGAVLGESTARLLDGLAEAEFRARLAVPLARAIGELGGARRRHAHPEPVPGELNLRDELAALSDRIAAGKGASAAGGRRPAPARSFAARALRPRNAIIVGLGLVCVSGAATASSVWLAPAGNLQYGVRVPLSTSAPPAPQLSALAVLRRSQTGGDRANGVDAALADVNDLSIGLRGDYVRVLAATADGPVVLAPVARRVTIHGGATQPAILDALCVYYPTTGSASLLSKTHCWSTQDVLAGRATAANRRHEYGLVPDGVRAVRVSAGSWNRIVPVRSNFFQVTLPPRRGGAGILAYLPVAATVTLVR